MPEILSSQLEVGFVNRGFSRRGFHKMATLLAAGGALPFYNERALAQRAAMARVIPPDAVKIDANENPMGPCAEAAEAIHAIVQKGGRYLSEEASVMAQTLAGQEDLKPGYVQVFAGSSDPLHHAVVAFCSKDRPFVTADPGYEAGGRAAQFIGAQAIPVPLVKGTFAHDVKAMAAAHPTPGVIYICNPNNPTGTLTSKDDIEWLVKNKPAGSVVLLDEAYIHLSRAEKASPLVAADKDVIILRTWSKLYGMAGLRAGAALARPDLLRKLSQYRATGFVPVTAAAGATASLKSKTVVPERRKLFADLCEEQFNFLAKHNIEFVRSDANMIMMNVKRPGRDFYEDMTHERVYIGRVWPVWPNWVRITIGTREDMARFQAACLKCYNA